MARTAIPFMNGKPAAQRATCPTQLAAWMAAHGVSARTIAKQIGYDPKMVRYWKDGQSMPPLIAAFKIERATEGGVPAASWLGTDLGKMLWHHAKKERE